MTRRITVKVKCQICRVKSERTKIISTTILDDFPDLDSRPPLLVRFTIDTWVHRCPSCGFCGEEDDAVDRKKVSRLIKTERYKDQLVDSSFPTLANSFLCASLILETICDPVGAGHASLYAAWVCDDQHYAEAAQMCRRRAISLFQGVRNKGIAILKDSEREEVFLADISRRAREFTLGLEICDLGLSKNPTDKVRTLLVFEKSLIEKKDSSRYTEGHALVEGYVPYAV